MMAAQVRRSIEMYRCTYAAPFGIPGGGDEALPVMRHPPSAVGLPTPATRRSSTKAVSSPCDAAAPGPAAAVRTCSRARFGGDCRTHAGAHTSATVTDINLNIQVLLAAMPANKLTEL